MDTHDGMFAKCFKRILKWRISWIWSVPWMNREERNSVAVFFFFFFLIFNFNHGHYWCICSFIFHWSFCTVVIGQGNRTVGCNWTPLTGQLKQPIILSLLCQSPNHRNDHNNHGNDHLSKEKLWHFQNGRIFNKRYCRHWRYLFYLFLFFRKLLRVMINLYQTFLSSNSVCNYTSDYWLQTELDSTRSYYHYESKV